MIRSKNAKRRPSRPPFIPAEPRNAAPHGAQLRARHDQDRPGFGQAHKIPQEVADAQAEAKVTGGYRTTRSNLCRTCFEYRSKNGSCACRSKIDDRKVRKLTTKIPRSNLAQ
jgi:hypothetical protein